MIDLGLPLEGAGRLGFGPVRPTPHQVLDADLACLVACLYDCFLCCVVLCDKTKFGCLLVGVFCFCFGVLLVSVLEVAGRAASVVRSVQAVGFLKK